MTNTTAHPKSRPPVMSIPQTPSVLPKCSVEKAPNGGMIVHFLIDKNTADRLRRKMGTMDEATYIWDNIVHRAVEGAAY